MVLPVDHQNIRFSNPLVLKCFGKDQQQFAPGELIHGENKLAHQLNSCIVCAFSCIHASINEGICTWIPWRMLKSRTSKIEKAVKKSHSNRYQDLLNLRKHIFWFGSFTFDRQNHPEKRYTHINIQMKYHIAHKSFVIMNKLEAAPRATTNDWYSSVLSNV